MCKIFQQTFEFAIAALVKDMFINIDKNAQTSHSKEVKDTSWNKDTKAKFLFRKLAPLKTPRKLI